MAKTGSRPLSPHLMQYRWGPHMMVSVLHRATGMALAIAGLLMLLGWLVALSMGQQAYAAFTDFARGPFGMIVLVGLSWSMFQHIANGVRHLVLDTGAGYELNSNRRWSTVVLFSGVVLTAIFWALVFRQDILTLMTSGGAA